MRLDQRVNAARSQDIPAGPGGGRSVPSFGIFAAMISLLSEGWGRLNALVKRCHDIALFDPRRSYQKGNETVATRKWMVGEIRSKTNTEHLQFRLITKRRCSDATSRKSLIEGLLRMLNLWNVLSSERQLPPQKEQRYVDARRCPADFRERDLVPRSALTAVLGSTLLLPGSASCPYSRHAARRVCACRGTWSISPELAGGADPIDGRDRLDLTGFSGSVISSVSETPAEITIETAFIRVAVRRSPLALTWSFRADETAALKPALQDRPTQAYSFERAGPRFAHSLARKASDHYYGFGEKSGDANKHGRRLRMRTTDALGYDAETSDPLYKHIPFYITVRPGSGAPIVGLFYDNLSHGAFDLGQEIDAYHGPYRKFEASDGDLDLYLMFGTQVRDVVTQFTALTGRTRVPAAMEPQLFRLHDAIHRSRRCRGATPWISLADARAWHPMPVLPPLSGYTRRDEKRYVLPGTAPAFPIPPRSPSNSQTQACASLRM